MPVLVEERLQDFPQYDPITLQLAYNRGLLEKEKLALFFNENGENGLNDPFLFQDILAACELIIGHIKKRSKITVFGDYDADGVTSSALLVEVLRTLKADADAYLPHRVLEGYGVSKSAIDLIAKGGTKLIITVDNGIRGKAEIEYAKSIGIDVIVSDHHVPPPDPADLPDCLIINPAMPDEKYPDKNLSGAGVALKLVQALVEKSTLENVQKTQLIRQSLDLSAIGTVADCVRLIGENRTIVKDGLEILSRTKRLGLKKLIEVSKINLEKPIDSWNIGFQIAPRLNAAGRMDHANTAYHLLLTKDLSEAERLASELDRKNQNRQTNTEEIFNEVCSQVDPQNDLMLIGMYNLKNDKAKEEEVWNEGVIGLVAGKVANKYFRPCLVITETEEGYKGSGRSIPDFNLITAIEKCADLLDKFGGHPAACGFSLKSENIGAFIKRIQDIAQSELSRENLRPLIQIEAELDLSFVNQELISRVKRFEPFGQGNDRPIFASRSVRIVDIQTIGSEARHIKLRLAGKSSGLIYALGFGQAERWKDLKINDMIDIAYHTELNVFNGHSEAQIKIIDIKKAQKNEI